jgi:hypothetical protein
MFVCLFADTNQRVENSKLSLQKEFAIQRKKMAETQDDRGSEIAEVSSIQCPLCCCSVLGCAGMRVFVLCVI